jgi:hypothetical protein
MFGKIAIIVAVSLFPIVGHTEGQLCTTTGRCPTSAQPEPAPWKPAPDDADVAENGDVTDDDNEDGFAYQKIEWATTHGKPTP